MADVELRVMLSRRLHHVNVRSGIFLYAIFHDQQTEATISARHRRIEQLLPAKVKYELHSSSAIDHDIFTSFPFSFLILHNGLVDSRYLKAFTSSPDRTIVMQSPRYRHQKEVWVYHTSYILEGGTYNIYSQRFHRPWNVSVEPVRLRIKPPSRSSQ